jgi:transcriptional regulator with XRE-family HTH domain
MHGRQVLEAALDCEDRSEAVWPPIAARIRIAREQSGLSWAAVAEHLGETPSNVQDPELYDDELCSVMSVGAIGRLAEKLGLTVDELLFGIPSEPSAPRISFSDIAAGLSRLLESEKVSAEELSDRIGWDIRRVLTEPDLMGEYPLDCLRRVCRTIGIDWVSALPRPRAVAG